MCKGIGSSKVVQAYSSDVDWIFVLEKEVWFEGLVLCVVDS